jgi:hypothetical protein
LLSKDTEEKRNAYTILVGKPKGMIPLARHRLRWEDNIKIDLKEIGWGGVDWIDPAQGKEQWRVLVNTGSARLRSVKYWDILEWLSSWCLLKKYSAAGS